MLAYTADTRADVPEASLDLLRGADLLLLDAIAPAGYRIHKHMTYDQALALAARLEPKAFRCVHLAHLVPWDLPTSGGTARPSCSATSPVRPGSGPAPGRRPRL